MFRAAGLRLSGAALKGGGACVGLADFVVGDQITAKRRTTDKGHIIEMLEVDQTRRHKKEVAMKTLEKILFPIDFSQCSEKVFPFALKMAQQFDAKLHLLFVARDISYLTDIGVHRDKLTKRVDEIAQAGENQMRAFCNNQLGGFPNHEGKVVTGDPGDEILKFAEEKGIDLIVMGTHGRRGLERTLMGSVADYVIKNAATPVMTVNPFRAKVD